MPGNNNGGEYARLEEAESRRQSVSSAGDVPTFADSSQGTETHRRGADYTELDIREPQGFDEEDDARYFEEFAAYDTHSPAKAPVWKRKRFSLIHICLAAIGCLVGYVLFSLVWTAATGRSSTGIKEPAVTHPPSAPGGEGHRSRKQLLTYDNVNRVNSIVETQSLDWIAHPDDPSIDGLYRKLDNGQFLVQKADNSAWKQPLATLLDVANAAKGLVDKFEQLSWSVSADWEYLLFNVHSERVWRHSAKGTYFLYNNKEKTMIPLTSTDNSRVQRVEWAPTGHSLLFVRDNNMYVTDMMHEIQVTEDGSDSVFNGISDWVYEEEVLGPGASSWWSPDGKALAYLRIDDSAVPVFRYELFHPDNKSILYPDEIQVHYPKPGSNNPTVSLFVYQPDFGRKPSQAKAVSKAADNPDTDFHPHSITFEQPFGPEDTIIADVTWVTDAHSQLLVHAMNRVQDHSKVYLVDADPKHLSAKMVRERNTATEDKGDGAWIEIASSPVFVPARSADKLTADGYLSLVENGEHTHLALFSPMDAAQPTAWLTSGDYDVVSGSLVYSRRTGKASFVSTKVSSTKFNLYEVSLSSGSGDSRQEQPVDGPRALSPPTGKSSSDRINSEGARDGTYEASFSAGAGFYALSYKGPKLPWQAVYSATDDKFELVLADNANAQSVLDNYDLPSIEYLEIPNEAGDKMNAMLIYPPDMDINAMSKYGVLFQVYGGPNSQMVTQSFALDWHAALVSQQDVPDMQWIVARVDGRGTGYKGRKYRSSISKQLGVLEPADQAAAARHLQKKQYVNPQRMAIWGWSYGGYTTAKAIERHSDVFRVGMAVAPVTSWRYYDSVYTERYMKTPQQNDAGYNASAVSNPDGFRKSRFLVQHGTGDDNVHLQNTLALVDLLESNNVPGFEMAMYADSDHSIYTHGVRPALYARMTNFLFRSFHELENKEADFWRHVDPNASSK